MNYDEWTDMIGRPHPHGRFVTHDNYGHMVTIADLNGTQARCTCGWTAPDRTGDPHAVALVVDDTGQHLHHHGLRCPEHDPPRWVCRECDLREAGGVRV